jgi:NADH-quinone oxidoreductase subunit J
MSVPDTLFWFFSIAMLVCGVLVIVNRNPVSSALFLVLLFCFMAGLFALLEAFFIAAIQILVYAGAVMVLFLFVVMLLDIRASARRRLAWLGAVGGLVVAGAFVWELRIILNKPIALAQAGTADVSGGLDSVVKPLFQHYLLPFEVTALLLLVAMVGVVLLSKKDLK